ncbi:MAG: OB-fold nucleic acid binding domain-containing protein [Methanobacteriota archaeon]
MRIEDVALGQYVRSPDGTEPSYLLTPWGEQVSRVRVMGTVVDKFIRDDQNYATLRIDDGSETVGLRAWQEGVKELDKFEIGNTVDVIGRVREFNGEIYLIPELIIKVEDPNWELVRELEIIAARREALASGVRPKVTKLEPRYLNIKLPQTAGDAEPSEADEEPLPIIPDEVKKRVVIAIEKLDTGSGVEPVRMSNELNMSLSQVNDTLRVLFVDGDVFEPTHGKFRLTR